MEDERPNVIRGSFSIAMAEKRLLGRDVQVLFEGEAEPRSILEEYLSFSKRESLGELEPRQGGNCRRDAKTKLSKKRGSASGLAHFVKTIDSKRLMSVDVELMGVLQLSKQNTQFSHPEDWMFASPVQLGKLTWSYSWIRKVFQRAAAQAGIGRLGTHAMRHSYRSWLDSVGTTIAVQQKLTRHSDIRTTMNIYGDVVTDEMAEAHSKVVGLALSQP